VLAVGDSVQDFALQDQHGETVRWSSFLGRPVVVFFYPRADTPGCTKEACAFRDLGTEFEAAGASIVGISGDTVKRQASFDQKHGLGLTLLADPDHVVLEPWGVWADKTLYGRTSKGIVRTTILFDRAGRVAQVWSPVKVAGHVDAVLARVRAG
jgi:thioredoxin-dependent peroxiredoxin